ncbi:Uncharacterized protein QTN25_004396 [Entamoeba marina]
MLLTNNSTKTNPTDSFQNNSLMKSHAPNLNELQIHFFERMKVIIIFAIIALCSAKSNNTTAIQPVKSEMCVGEVPVCEITRIQKRVANLEGRVEQFQKLLAEIEEKLSEIEKDKTKKLSPSDRDTYFATKLSLLKKRICLVNYIKRLTLMIKKTVSVLPSDLRKGLIKNLKIKLRIKRLNKILNTFKTSIRSDSELIRHEAKSAAKIAVYLNKHRAETEKIVTKLVIASLKEENRKHKKSHCLNSLSTQTATQVSNKMRGIIQSALLGL